MSKGYLTDILPTTVKEFPLVASPRVRMLDAHDPKGRRGANCCKATSLMWRLPRPSLTRALRDSGVELQGYEVDLEAGRVLDVRFDPAFIAAVGFARPGAGVDGRSGLGDRVNRSHSLMPAHH